MYDANENLPDFCKGIYSKIVIKEKLIRYLHVIIYLYAVYLPECNVYFVLKE
jgi:hypothetical protein